MSSSPRSWPALLRARWPARGQGRSGALWRAFLPVALLLAGALFVTSATSSDGTDLRAGEYGDLPGLVRQQSQQLHQLHSRANRLSDRVQKLSARVGDKDVTSVQQRARSLREPAGLVPVQGPGLTVALDDAPAAVIDSSGIDPLRLIVHQQDIQAVVNAMWAGGAEAMTVQGQRVVSTTGIKCVGNTVVLHHVPYSPPYTVTAVGDPDAMLTSVNASPYIKIYKQYVEAYQLGYDVQAREHVRLPGYDGSLGLDYARVPQSPSEQTGDNGV